MLFGVAVDWKDEAVKMNVAGSLTIRTAGQFAHSDRYFRTTYCMSHYALHLYDYPCTMSMDGNHADIQPGSLTLSLPARPTAYHLEAPGHHWCIHFELSQAELPADDAVELPLLFNTGELSSTIADQFAHISRLYTRAVSAHSHQRSLKNAAEHALHSLLFWLAAVRPLGTSRPATRIEIALDQCVSYINQRLHRDISIVNVARHVGFSQNYLSRCFRQEFGMTLQHYLLTRRCEVACHLLRHTSLSVKDVGIRVGVPDAQHFNKLFRSVMKVSPSHYRSGQ